MFHVFLMKPFYSDWADYQHGVLCMRDGSVETKQKVPGISQGDTNGLCFLVEKSTNIAACSRGYKTKLSWFRCVPVTKASLFGHEYGLNSVT